jgi:hypothetical protein
MNQVFQLSVVFPIGKRRSGPGLPRDLFFFPALFLFVTLVLKLGIHSAVGLVLCGISDSFFALDSLPPCAPVSASRLVSRRVKFRFLLPSFLARFFVWLIYGCLCLPDLVRFVLVEVVFYLRHRIKNLSFFSSSRRVFMVIFLSYT